MTATPSNSGIFIVPDNVVSDSMKFVNFLIAKYKADDNSIEKGYKLGECKIVSHIKYDIPYDAIYFNDISITGDNIVKEVN